MGWEKHQSFLIKMRTYTTETVHMKLTALSIIRNATRSHIQTLFNLMVMLSVSLEHKLITEEGDIKAEIKNPQCWFASPRNSKVLLLDSCFWNESSCPIWYHSFLEIKDYWMPCKYSFWHHHVPDVSLYVSYWCCYFCSILRPQYMTEFVKAKQNYVCTHSWIILIIKKTQNLSVRRENHKADILSTGNPNSHHLAIVLEILFVHVCEYYHTKQWTY